LSEYPYGFARVRGNPAQSGGTDRAAHRDVSPWRFRCLGDAGFTAQEMNTKAEITLVKLEDGFAVTKVGADPTGQIPGIDAAKFRSWRAWRKKAAHLQAAEMRNYPGCGLV